MKERSILLLMIIVLVGLACSSPVSFASDPGAQQTLIALNIQGTLLAVEQTEAAGGGAPGQPPADQPIDPAAPAAPAAAPTYTPYPTYTVPPSSTPNPTDTTAPTSTVEAATPTDDGPLSFKEITRSTNSFACGGNPASITISARVNNQPEVYYIDFFWQMIDKTTQEKTEYLDKNMSFEGDDLYKITIKANQVPNPKKWTDAWFSYQLVMANKDNEYVRSDYYSDVSFKPCP